MDEMTKVFAIIAVTVAICALTVLVVEVILALRPPKPRVNQGQHVQHYKRKGNP